MGERLGERGGGGRGEIGRGKHVDDNGEPEPISGRMNDIFGRIRAQVKSKEFHKSRKPISRLTRVSLPNEAKCENESFACGSNHMFKGKV